MHLKIKGKLMNQTKILEQLGNKDIDADEALIYIRKNTNSIPAIINGINSTNPRIKFGCAKILSKLSQEKPEKLYKEIDFFTDMLDHKNNIIKWNAMDILANLSRVDTKNKFDNIFDKYFELLNDDTMITLGHVVDNSSIIANAKPHLAEKITKNLLKLEKIKTKPKVTKECKNILYGKAILAFDKYYSNIDNREEVISFVKRQLKNSRLSTKVKAEKFLKKYQ